MYNWLVDFSSFCELLRICKSTNQQEFAHTTILTSTCFPIIVTNRTLQFNKSTAFVQLISWFFKFGKVRHSTNQQHFCTYLVVFQALTGANLWQICNSISDKFHKFSRNSSLLKFEKVLVISNTYSNQQSCKIYYIIFSLDNFMYSQDVLHINQFKYFVTGHPTPPN